MEHSAAETLIVVDDVEFASAAREMPGGTQRERQRFGESATPHADELHPRWQITQLSQGRSAERVRLGEQIEPRQFRESHAVIDLRIGRAGQHLDPMPECGELAAQMPYVHALPTAARVSPVGQQRDTQRAHRSLPGAPILKLFLDLPGFLVPFAADLE